MSKRAMNLRLQALLSLKLTLDEIYDLPENACIRVNNTNYNNLFIYALHRKIKDPSFWNVISKYENYERTLHKLGHQKTMVHRYILMTKEDVIYLFSRVNYKPKQITAFLKTKYTKDELEEQHNKTYHEYEQKIKEQKDDEKRKLLNLN